MHEECEKGDGTITAYITDNLLNIASKAIPAINEVEGSAANQDTRPEAQRDSIVQSSAISRSVVHSLVSGPDTAPSRERFLPPLSYSASSFPSQALTGD